MAYQPQNRKNPDENERPEKADPSGMSSGTGYPINHVDTSHPRWMAGLSALILALVLMTWRVGPPATTLVPVLLLILFVHLFALGWGYAQYSPFTRIIQLVSGLTRRPSSPTDAEPHARNAQQKVMLYMPLCLGMAPWLTDAARTGVFIFGAILFALAVFEAVTGRLIPPGRSSSNKR